VAMAALPGLPAVSEWRPAGTPVGGVVVSGGGGGGRSEIVTGLQSSL